MGRNKVMDNLTIKQKVDLFKDLYTELAGYGIKGDTELAHVNKYEAAVLKAMGGSSTVNPVTGLNEYWDDDDDPAPAPTTTTVRQVADLPEYFKPYAEKVLATAEDIYEQPYVPYEDRRLAPISEEQQLAFTGLRDLYSDVDPSTGERTFRSPTAGAFETAEGLAEKGAAQFGELEEGVFEEKYMSPYTKAVTDIQVREAQRRADEQRKQLASSAMQAGALGSSRFGVQEALRGEAEQRLLSDIEQQGLQRAYTQGQQAFEADRAAARAGATQYGALGTQGQAAGLAGLGALQATGETQRAIEQQPIDLSYEEFVRQQQYPRQSLQELSGIVRGFPVQPSTYETKKTFEQPPSLSSQLLAAGTLGAGISSGLGKSLFGKASVAGGGLINSLPRRYAQGNEVIRIEASGPHGDKITVNAEILKNMDDMQFKIFLMQEGISGRQAALLDKHRKALKKADISKRMGERERLAGIAGEAGLTGGEGLGLPDDDKLVEFMKQTASDPGLVSVEAGIEDVELPSRTKDRFTRHTPAAVVQPMVQTAEADISKRMGEREILADTARPDVIPAAVAETPKVSSAITQEILAAPARPQTIFPPIGEAGTGETLKVLGKEAFSSIVDPVTDYFYKHTKEGQKEYLKRYEAEKAKLALAAQLDPDPEGGREEDVRSSVFEDDTFSMADLEAMTREAAKGRDDTTYAYEMEKGKPREGPLEFYTGLEKQLADKAVTEKAGETVKPIFDIGAAMPFFELAAEFGKSGRSTADSLAAAAQVHREGEKTRATSARLRALAEQARTAASVDFKGQKLSLRQAENLLKTYIAKQQAYLKQYESLQPAAKEEAKKELKRLDGDIDRLTKMYENALGLAPRTPAGAASKV